MTSTRPFSSRRTSVPPVATPGPVTAVDVAPPIPAVPSRPTTTTIPPAAPQLEPDDPDAVDPTPTRRRYLVPALIALTAVAIGVAVTFWITSRTDATTPDDVDAAIGEAFSSTTVAPPLGPAIYSTVLPSLTFIQSGEQGSDGASIGSGVVINTDGLIMTSNHVVDSSPELRVTFADGTESAARVVQSDPSIDIAILEPSTLPEVVVPAVLGGGVRVGEPVFALGNPLGLGGSFSAGVVSGLDRSLPLPDGSELADLIQFDAAVNPGSSGGPLVDQAGQVVGIVTAIANPTGEDFFSGIGFAVPIATAGGAAGGPQQ